jgi:hypothetical protein
MARLGNTPTRQTNFFLDRGKSYAFDLLFEDMYDAPFSLVDSDVRIVAEAPEHLGGEEVITKFAVVIDAVLGHVQFQLQAADTYLEPAEYPYDITLLAPTGYSSPVLKGVLVIGANTDDDISNSYAPSEVAPQITVTMHNGATVKVCLPHGVGHNGGVLGSEEVWIGSSNPPRGQELWIDTDEPDPTSGLSASTGYYRHDQTQPSSSWVVNHRLGYRPAVHSQDDNGNLWYGSVRHLSDSTLVITFKEALTGSAHCS